MAQVLIAEDDLVMADMVELVLIKSGYQVCGIARTVQEAVALAKRHRPDLAVIDVRLAQGDLGTEIVAKSHSLDKSGILYATGNISAMMRDGVQGHACLTKPYSFPDLVRSLELVAEIKATGTTTAPHPRGFRLLPITTASQV